MVLMPLCPACLGDCFKPLEQLGTTRNKLVGNMNLQSVPCDSCPMLGASVAEHVRVQKKQRWRTQRKLFSLFCELFWVVSNSWLLKRRSRGINRSLSCLLAWIVLAGGQDLSFAECLEGPETRMRNDICKDWKLGNSMEEFEPREYFHISICLVCLSRLILAPIVRRDQPTTAKKLSDVVVDVSIIAVDMREYREICA